MYRHILVLLDHTDGSVEAVGQAVELARALGARVTFAETAACSGPHTALSEANDAQPAIGDAEIIRARALLARAEAAARAHGVACTSVIATSGITHATAARMARERRCDLIGLASPHTAADGEQAQITGIGAIAATAANSDVPVLLFATERRPVASHVIASLLGDHRRVLEALDEWQALLHAQRDGVRADTAFASMRTVIDVLDAFHAKRQLGTEQAAIFPRLRAKASMICAEIDELERQHQHNGQRIGELTTALAQTARAQLPIAQLEQAVEAYALFMWNHIGREEGVILPAARRFLDEADWLAIDTAIADIVAGTANARPARHVTGHNLIHSEPDGSHA